MVLTRRYQPICGECVLHPRITPQTLISRPRRRFHQGHAYQTYAWGHPAKCGLVFKIIFSIVSSCGIVLPAMARALAQVFWPNCNQVAELGVFHVAHARRRVNSVSQTNAFWASSYVAFQCIWITVGLRCTPMRVEVLVSDPNRPASIDKQGKLLINFVESCRHGPGRLTFAMLANPLVIEGQSDLTRESTFVSLACPVPRFMCERRWVLL